MVADAVLIHAALASAMALRFAWLVAFPGGRSEVNYFDAFWNNVGIFCRSAWPLTAVSLIVFFLSGFYTYGRAYQGKYKALIVAQAATQSYLLFGFLTYFFFFGGPLHVPRGALVLAWLFTVVLLVSARLWTNLWEKIIRPERERMMHVEPGRPRRVLVIGGAGYIGSALLPKLLEKGNLVRVLDMLIYGDEPVRSVLDHPNLEVLQGDFRRADRVVEAMRNVDAVVHLGAIVGDPACDLDEQLTLDINLHATRMIAEVAKASGIRRFVFASTCSVYGATDEMLDERSEVKPISLYGRTKLAAEKLLLGMSSSEFSPSIVRFATIYGLSGRTRMDLVVNLLSAKAKCDGEITVFGGDQWRPFVHVEDAAEAVSQVLDAPLAVVGNEVFNVGSDEQNFQIRDIGELIHQEVVGAELICKESMADKRNYRVSFARIRNELGFVPRWTVIQGIRQVVEAVANGQIEDYRDPRYSNAKSLEAGGVTRIRDKWLDEVINSVSADEVAA